jgi:hypothetical protein
MPKPPTGHLTGVNTATPTDTDSGAKGLSRANDDAAGCELLFRDRVPEAAARQLACVLAWAAECALATAEQIDLRKSASRSDRQRHRSIALTLVLHCKELGVNPRAGLNGPCPRLADAITEGTEKT